MKMIREKEEGEIQNAMEPGQGQGDILDREVDIIETITTATSTTTQGRRESPSTGEKLLVFFAIHPIEAVTLL